MTLRYSAYPLAVFVIVMLAVTAVGAIRRPTTREAIARAGTGFRIDINRDGPATLRLLPGVGPSLARQVVEHREAHGPFVSPDGLDAVPRFGPATIHRLRGFVVCGRDTKGRASP